MISTARNQILVKIQYTRRDFAFVNDIGSMAQCFARALLEPNVY
jgi:hypothetical protein